jgi:hypothetical protein
MREFSYLTSPTKRYRPRKSYVSLPININHYPNHSTIRNPYYFPRVHFPVSISSNLPTSAKCGPFVYRNLNLISIYRGPFPLATNFDSTSILSTTPTIQFLISFPQIPTPLTAGRQSPNPTPRTLKFQISTSEPSRRSAPTTSNNNLTPFPTPVPYLTTERVVININKTTSIENQKRIVPA